MQRKKRRWLISSYPHPIFAQDSILARVFQWLVFKSLQYRVSYVVALEMLQSNLSAKQSGLSGTVLLVRTEQCNQDLQPHLFIREWKALKAMEGRLLRPLPFPFRFLPLHPYDALSRSRPLQVNMALLLCNLSGLAPLVQCRLKHQSPGQERLLAPIYGHQRPPLLPLALSGPLSYRVCRPQTLK